MSASQSRRRAAAGERGVVSSSSQRLWGCMPPLERLGVDEHHDVDVGAERVAVVVAELAGPAGHVHQRVGVALGAGQFSGRYAVGVGILGAPAGFGEAAQFVLEDGELIRRQQRPHTVQAVVTLEGGDAAAPALAHVALGSVVAGGLVGPAAQEAAVLLDAHRLGGADQLFLVGLCCLGDAARRGGEVQVGIDAEINLGRHGDLGEGLRVTVREATAGERLTHLWEILQRDAGARSGQRLPAAHTRHASQPAGGVDRSLLGGHIAPRRHGQQLRLIGVQPRPRRPHRPQASPQAVGVGNCRRATPQHPKHRQQSARTSRRQTRPPAESQRDCDAPQPRYCSRIPIYEQGVTVPSGTAGGPWQPASWAWTPMVVGPVRYWSYRCVTAGCSDRGQLAGIELAGKSVPVLRLRGLFADSAALA